MNFTSGVGGAAWHFGRSFLGATLTLLTLLVHAAPQLVTPQLPPAIQGQPYSASLMIGSALPLTSVAVAGLPAGLVATHNGNGSIAITGAPASTGRHILTVAASDSGAGTLGASVSLVVERVANNVAMVSAGYDSSCAAVDGGVQCWGTNGSGQLGNNTRIASRIPIQAIPAGSGVTMVSIGPASASSCAVINGGVKCWGSNGSGQLGRSTFPDGYGLVAGEAIAAGSNVTAVTTGGSHSCALANGGVQCWGGGGLLGNGTYDASLVPVQTIAAGSNATSVSAGWGHTCAAVDGGVQCWGLNTSYQLNLPINTTHDSDVPIQVIPSGSNATAVSAGAYHTCAVVNGGVQCWGFFPNGRLGSDPDLFSLGLSQAIAAGSNVTAVSAGGSHSCAVVNGGVQCWGNNTDGRLGDNTTTGTFVPVQAIAAGSGVTGVSAGERHTCAVVNGVVRCWGYNYDGELGNNRPSVSRTPAVAIAAGSKATDVSAGYPLSCAVVSGGVQCWGTNYSRGLGNNSVVPSLSPVQTIPAGSGATEVSSSSDQNSHSCAVVDGGVQCWGANYEGRLGVGTTTTFSGLPVQTIPAGSNVATVRSGKDHSCAALNGGVQCWGSNSLGQLGKSGITQSNLPVQTIAAGSNVTALSAGFGYTCVVINGGVQCWGFNTSLVQSLLPVQMFPAGSDAARVAVGGHHACAVVNGGVQCWGSNDFGQLGNNSYVSSLAPVQAIPAGSNASAVAAGEYHACAVVADGVQCWGNNYSGQLGNNSSTQSAIPIQVLAVGSNATTVSAGYAHNCAVVGGGVVCWGDNSLGQLADAYSAPPIIPIVSLVGATINTGVQSRKSHGVAGTFDLALDNTLAAPNVTLESRAIGAGHTIVFQFNTPITAAGSVNVVPVGPAGATA
ncbi:MAG: hypothetical protein ABL931_17310, partial [Usitatibacteraceae bacterium]